MPKYLFIRCGDSDDNLFLNIPTFTTPGFWTLGGGGQKADLSDLFKRFINNLLSIIRWGFKEEILNLFT